MKNWKVGVLAAVLLGGAFVLVLQFLNRVGVPVRGSMKLADLKSQGQNAFSFKCPPNEKIWFVLGTTNRARNAFKGTIGIQGTDGSACQHPFSSEDLRRCSWLRTYGLNGFAICHSNEVGSLDGWPLSGGEAYSGTISIDAKEDGDVSLWLYWFGKEGGG